MFWFFERQKDVLMCEIRRGDDDRSYELEIAGSKAPLTRRFNSLQEVIASYVEEQTRLMADGWRPRGAMHRPNGR